jgi:hypothetical protein
VSESDPLEGGRVWEGYSDYQKVSIQNALTIQKAIEAYSYVDSAHSSGSPVDPETAANARGAIKAALMTVLSEMKRERDSKEIYDEVLTRWEDGEDDEEGYIQRFEECDLTAECPGFLFDLVIDIRSAAWELGYLQAGRTVSEDTGDPVEREPQAMFEGI